MEVWAVPGASRTEVGGMHDGALRIRVATPAAAGEANRAIGVALAAAAGVRRAEMVAGFSGRRKRFLVRGVDPSELAERLR